MKSTARYLISFIIGIIIAFTTKIPVLSKFILIIFVVLICQIFLDCICKYGKKKNDE